LRNIFRRNHAAILFMSSVRCLKLLGAAVLFRVRCAFDRVVSPLRRLDGAIIWILHQLRRTTGADGAEDGAAGKTTQADVRLGKVRYIFICHWSSLHRFRPRIHHAQAGSRAIYFIADKSSRRRRLKFYYRFTSDVQRLRLI